MGSVTRAFEETHVGRLIKALLLQPSESYHPLMPSTLLKNIQRLTCTRRFQNVGTLSGGERQAVAIARAVYFGANVLILDEPTSALGVKQSGIVLKYIVQARSLGRAVIFITHNPHHAYPVGDRFVLLKRGRMLGSYLKSETTLDQLTSMMAGGAELEQLSHELQGLTTDPAIAEVAKEVAAEAAEVKTTA